MLKGLQNLLIDKEVTDVSAPVAEPAPIVENVEEQVSTTAEGEESIETQISESIGEEVSAEIPETTLSVEVVHPIRFREIVKDIFNQWAHLVIEPMAMLEVRSVVAKILQYRHRYELIEKKSGVPWYLVAVLHYRESSFNFECNLCNGEHLDVITTKEPKGHGPYHSWEEGAIDALYLQKLHLIPHWSIERVLFEIERFNGFGYRRRGGVSPYVWAYSNLHDGRGIYVADKVFDENAKSAQLGAGVVLNYMTTMGAVNPSYEGR